MNGLIDAGAPSTIAIILNQRLLGFQGENTKIAILNMFYSILNTRYSILYSFINLKAPSTPSSYFTLSKYIPTGRFSRLISLSG